MGVGFYNKPKKVRIGCHIDPAYRGVGKGGSEGSDDPIFLGANFIHCLYKVLGL